jgi:transcription initiation factor IIE alpha subunit
MFVDEELMRIILKNLKKKKRFVSENGFYVW